MGSTRFDIAGCTGKPLSSEHRRVLLSRSYGWSFRNLARRSPPMSAYSQTRGSVKSATAKPPPTTTEGIEKYLGSGMIRGIGPVYARKMVKAFGEKVFDVIEAEPGRLREVTGIGPMRAKRITGAWAEQKIVREIMVFLHSHGVGTARAVRIFKTYGVDAVQVMTENPYRLARDIRGIGFKTTHPIAIKPDIDKHPMIPVRARNSHALTPAIDAPRCAPPTDGLTTLS